MATVKCPVCDYEIKDAGIKVRAGKRDLVVCSEECAKDVQTKQSGR